MKKHTLILSLFFVIICSFTSKAGNLSFHKRHLSKVSVRAQINPSADDELFRIKAFKAFTLARRHHLAMIAAENAK